MELTSGLLSREQYLRAIVSAVEFLRSAGVGEILVSYGFGCDCPDEQLYQQMPMQIDRLPSFVADSVTLDFYRVGEDNLHVGIPGGGLEFLFCHESDIHFISDDVRLVDRLSAEWSSWGWPGVLVRPNQEVQPDEGGSRVEA